MTVVCLLLPAFVPASAKNRSEKLNIYLPREITICKDSLTLDQVGIVRGDESLVSKAGNIVLGHFSTPGQNIVIDRNTILSRLACNGIPVSRVALTGAEAAVVKRQHRLITGKQFVEKATAYLKNNLPDASICRWDVLHIPADLTLPGADGETEFLCRLIQNGAANQCSVRVTAVQSGREMGRREVMFRFSYQCRKVITKTPIIKGQVISAENIKIEKSVSRYPESPGWTAPYGLVAARSMPAKTIITTEMVSNPRPEVLIKRNQSVAIKIENTGILATAVGKALQDGVVGEYIKVQNVDSKIIIMAKIAEDGTVEPVY